MSASDQEIIAALPAILGDRVVDREAVVAALVDAGLDMGTDADETLRRATSMEGVFGDLAGGFVHMPAFLDGTVWSVEITEIDLEKGVIHDPHGIDPLIWWLITEEVSTLGSDGDVNGLIEIDSLDGITDVVLLHDAVADALRPGWATVTVTSGGLAWAPGDEPAAPSDAQIAAAHVAVDVAMNDERADSFDLGVGANIDLDDVASRRTATDTTTLLEAIIADRAAFVDHPIPKVDELFEAAGYEVRDRDIARPGFDWDALELWRSTNQATMMFDLDGDRLDTYQTLIGAFTAWRSGGLDAVPDHAALLGLFDSDQRAISAFAAGPNPGFVSDGDERRAIAEQQLAFVDALLESAESAASPQSDATSVAESAASFRASCLDRMGRPVDAAAVLDAALDGATSPTLLQMAAEFTADRGDAPAAYEILRRMGALEHLSSVRGEAETHTPDLELLFEVEPFAMSRPKDETGRNDPCPCGSGKKYKKCHLGTATHTLAFRSPWLHAKATRFARTGAPSLIEALADQVTAHIDDPEFSAEMVWSPFIADLALHEGDLMHEFLAARRDLLPADEAELAGRWCDAERGVFIVEHIGGQTVRLQNVTTEERITVGEMATGEGITTGDLMVGRPLPVGDAWRAFGGFMPVVPELVDDLLVAIEGSAAMDIAELIGSQMAPEDDDPMGGLDLSALGLDLDALGLDELAG